MMVKECPLDGCTSMRTTASAFLFDPFLNDGPDEIERDAFDLLGRDIRRILFHRVSRSFVWRNSRCGVYALALMPYAIPFVNHNPDAGPESSAGRDRRIPSGFRTLAAPLRGSLCRGRGTSNYRIITLAVQQIDQP